MTENKKHSAQKDTLLIQAFMEGDSRAFDQLVLRHKDRVFNLCYGFFNDYQEANDIAQEIFIKVFKSIKKFRQESSFSTWLYRVAINTCKNRIKSLEYRFTKWRKSIDNPSTKEEESATMEIKNGSMSPSERLVQKERLSTVRGAINSLTNGKKTMILLRDIEGFSYEEIAKITGLNIGTVRSKLSRARNDLRAKLEGAV
jgi:RNA polymerase sigma-70 factor (ECF subfamily)